MRDAIAECCALERNERPASLRAALSRSPSRSNRLASQIANCYVKAMRDFTTIITDAGSDATIAQALGIKPHQPRDWRLRNSVPAQHWQEFARREWATLEELAAAAATGAGLAA